jgi:type I restriction enzyme S subunit
MKRLAMNHQSQLTKHASDVPEGPTNLYSRMQKKRLKYCAHIEMGQSPASTEYEQTSNVGLPFMQGTADFGSELPTPTVYCQSPPKIAEVNSILFSVRAPVGLLNIANQQIGIGRGLCAIISGREMHPRFVWWAVHVARESLKMVSTGSTYEAVSVEDVANMTIVVPSPETQHSIAEYLDRETAKIDQMLEAKEKLLKILDEKRLAIITHAVTKGVNPSTKLKSSGIPWLGDIPAHWKIVRAKWLFKERDERSTVGDEVLLSLRMEKGLVPHNDVSDKQTTPEELIGYKKTSVGEIVINRMRAASGLIAITPMEGLVSPDYAVFQVSAEVDAIFYKHLFTTELLQGVFRSESTGLGTGSSGFLRLYSDSFLSLWFPFPQLEEQRTIVEHIKKETIRMDSMSLVTQRTIELLKERRISIISDAVTGKLRVQ